MPLQEKCTTFLLQPTNPPIGGQASGFEDLEPILTSAHSVRFTLFCACDTPFVSTIVKFVFLRPLGMLKTVLYVPICLTVGLQWQGEVCSKKLWSIKWLEFLLTIPHWGSFGQQRLHFVDPMEPAPLFNTPRGNYTQVVNLDDFQVPDVHHSPLINASWDILGIPEADKNDDHVCPSLLPPEAVRDAQTALRVPAHDQDDEAVRLPPRELMINAQQLHALLQPVDARWLSLRTQQGGDFAQRDALCINVGGNFVDNRVDCACEWGVRCSMLNIGGSLTLGGVEVHRIGASCETAASTDALLQPMHLV